jgi:corrinoid protein of di/trimethylamine methyltransferase
MTKEKELLDGVRKAIVNLDFDGIKEASEKALTADIPAYKVVMQGMAKGMEIVGQKYEDGEYFLAELIMAGETMKEGMAVVEPHLETGDIESAGKLVIGTVRGDLHDIGKNVTITLLKAANFDVFDLGVDASPEQFVEAVKEHDADIVAMSALLTTTMVEMRKVIEGLENEGLRDKVKVIIGGAPITSEYASEIGADAAAIDAVDGVRICSDLLKG